MTSLITKKYKVNGMHCVSCAMLIEGALEDSGLVNESVCKYNTSELTLKSEKEVDDNKVIELVAKLGYKTLPLKC